MKAILDHIGIAVGDLSEALTFYSDVLGLEIETTEDVTSQGVRAHFVPIGGVSLELLEATSKPALWCGRCSSCVCSSGECSRGVGGVEGEEVRRVSMVPRFQGSKAPES